MESLKFVPFNSTIHPGFWSELSKIKLDVSGLKEEPIDVWATFINSDDPASGLAPRLCLEWSAFDQSVQTNWNCFGVKGKVVIKNTIEAFKSEDKSAFIRSEADVIWGKISDRSWLDNPDVLTTFSVLIFADLKKYMFYYWFAIPAFNMPTRVKMKSCENIIKVLSQAQCDQMASAVKQSESRIYSVTVIEDNESVKIYPLKYLETNPDLSKCFVTVADPSSGSYPGWSVRNLIFALTQTYPDKISAIRILCLRNVLKNGQLSISNSFVISLNLEESGDAVSLVGDMPAVVGWEKNDKGQLGPRLANMRSSMDPVKIAESSVDLNLKLMKWRLVPDLNLDLIMRTKCLLLGAGTLGCAVARCLLGWGVRNITLLDSGKVSFSNPVRQSLFTFQDCLNGGRPKAVAAAERLREIFPGVKAEGEELAIPMPGHTATGVLLDQAKTNYQRLEKLISEHDVIFLLMDSRESRWLPTALAALHPVKNDKCKDKCLIFIISGETCDQRSSWV